MAAYGKPTTDLRNRNQSFAAPCMNVAFGLPAVILLPARCSPGQDSLAVPPHGVSSLAAAPGFGGQPPGQHLRQGGNRSLAASAKALCQTGKSGHSRPSNRNPHAAPRTSVDYAQRTTFAKSRSMPDVRARSALTGLSSLKSPPQRSFRIATIHSESSIFASATSGARTKRHFTNPERTSPVDGSRQLEFRLDTGASQAQYFNRCPIREVTGRHNHCECR